MRRLPLSLLAALFLVGSAVAQPIPDSLFDAFSYRHIGPVGNRVSAVVGVPGDPNVYYFGAASGGVFKSTDGGIHWTPIFDDQDVASIGAMAIAPSDPNVVWVGTGEAFIRSNVSIGTGVYRSTDAGKTWQHVGLEETGRIGRIVVHPDDPDVAYVAATGHLYGPQEERGVFRTTDGGQSWERVLFVDPNTGAADIAMDPSNPRILFAGMWQMQIWPWGRESGGPGSGLYVSRDGGDTWTELTGNGLPKPPLGKIGLAIAPSDPDRVYALIETNSNDQFAPVDQHQGVLWRSDDGGRTWEVVSKDHALAQRPLYYSRMAVAPDDPDEVHFVSTVHTVSTDGGLTAERSNAGGDNHDIWIDPVLPDRIIVGHDGGLSISTTRGEQWWRPRLPIAQMYHGYADSSIPYNVMGNRQDGPSMHGPSNSLTGPTIPIGAWKSVGGCESGFAVPNPADPNIIWSGCYEGILDRHDLRTGHSRTVSVWPDNPEGWAAKDLRYRFQWTFPILVSPHDPERVYVGSQHVHRTTDGGQSWTVISPDLTQNDTTRQLKTGGLTYEDVSPTYYSVLFALAESPLEEGLLWAGSNDGLVHVSRNGGESWTNVTANLPDDLPPNGTISNIEPSPHAAGTATLSVDRHQFGDTMPYIYRTTDYGETWAAIGEGIPEGVLSYVHVVREDPVRPGLLYAGTENSVYVSFDAGATWQSLRTDLPPAPVHWLEVQPHFKDLVVATYGRGFWILDDVTPLQHLTPEVLAEDAALLPPRPAYRFLQKEEPQSQPESNAAGENPAYGASIHVWLASAPDSTTRLAILDAAGDTVRVLKEAKLKAGLNRVMWDLRHTASATPKLRTPPKQHDHVALGDDDWRPLGEGGRVAPLAVPGTYSVALTTGGETFTQPLEVRKDPGSDGTEATIAEQIAFTLQIRDDVNEVVDLIDRIEWMRKQLADLVQRLEAEGGHASLIAEARDLDAELQQIEGRLFDLRLTGGNARQDTIRYPRRLYAKLVSLAGYASGTDHRPTDQQREVYARYEAKLADVQATMQTFEAGPLAAFNTTLASRGLAGVF